MSIRLVTLARSPAPPDSATPPSVNDALLLFAAVTIVLVVLLAVTLILLRLYRRRLRGSRKHPVSDKRDPWVEAGRRLRPYRRK
jgi:hypothetical protein